MYKSTTWKSKRQFILKRDDYICQESKRYGRIVPANHVHHIYPVENYPELRFINWNLISLSQIEHNRMHDRVTNEITGKGIYWQRKRRKEFEIWKKKKSLESS